MNPSTVGAVIGASVLAFILAFVAVKFLDRLRRKDAETEAKNILDRAEMQAKNLRKEAELEMKERAIQRRAEMDDEINKARDQLRDRERLLDKRQETVEHQTDDLRKQERIVENTQRRLAERLEETNKRNEELSKLTDMQRQTLHELSGLNRDEATDRLMSMLDQELTQETGALILKHKKKYEETAQADARVIMLTTLQRYSSAHTAESTTSTVDIPSDEMKGRIIGREGRNIRAFEKRPALTLSLTTRQAW